MNAFEFLFQLTLPPPTLERFLATFALIPARYFGTAPPASILGYLPFVSDIFLHGEWLHLILNMWTLWMFGHAVEDRRGTVRFVIIYLAAVIAAFFVHAIVNTHSAGPALGATGVIAGVIGCYAWMFPSAQRVMIVPIIFVPILIKMPAIGFAFFWMMSQIISGIMTLMMLTDGGGIAGWAHMGGFIVVWILAPLVKRPARSYCRYYGDEGFYRFFPRASRMKGGSQWIY